MARSPPPRPRAWNIWSPARRPPSATFCTTCNSTAELSWEGGLGVHAASPLPGKSRVGRLRHDAGPGASACDAAAPLGGPGSRGRRLCLAGPDALVGRPGSPRGPNSRAAGRAASGRPSGPDDRRPLGRLRWPSSWTFPHGPRALPCVPGRSFGSPRVWRRLPSARVWRR